MLPGHRSTAGTTPQPPVGVRSWVMSNFDPAEAAVAASRNIPAAVKLAVRQRCGFGCIFCGSPVFQYDHLIDFAETQEHDPANLNLLCPTHHAQKTAGRLGREAVAKRALNPVNKAADRSVTGMPLEIASDRMLFTVGGNRFENDRAAWGGEFQPIVIRGRPVIEAKWAEGWLSLNLVLSDEFGNPLLSIEDGELRTTTKTFDFEMVGRSVRLRSKVGMISAQIELGDAALNVSRGLFVQGDRVVAVGADGCRIGSFVYDGGPDLLAFRGGNPMSGLVAVNCRVGIEC